jgi:FkbM family methyltransferase
VGFIYLREGSIIQAMNIIQIGCDDCQDEAFQVISKNGEKIAKLLIIDAMPKAIEIASEKYSYLGSKFIAVHCAIGCVNGIVPIYHPKDNQRRCAQASLSKDFIVNIHPDVTCTYIPSLTINDFLRSLGMDSIDYFYIDTEGYDTTILLDMDFDRFLPKNIMYEYSHSDGFFQATKKHELLQKKLSLYGYKVEVVDRFNIRCAL